MLPIPPIKGTRKQALIQGEMSVFPCELGTTKSLQGVRSGWVGFGVGWKQCGGRFFVCLVVVDPGSLKG